MNNLEISKTVLGYLQEFGLNDKEIIIYLTLLRLGPSTIMDLARKTAIKRSTTHNNVEELIKKGLVSQTNYGERRMVIAEDPSKLKFLLEQRKWEVNKLEDNMDEIVGELFKFAPEAKVTTRTEMKYYDGEKGFKEVCQRSISNSKKEVFFISNIDEWRKVYTEEYGKEYYIPERKKKNIFLRELVINNNRGIDFKKDDVNNLRKTKVLPNSFQFKNTLIITDRDISIMISTEPYKAISIENQDVVETFKNIFENLWEISN